MEHDNVKAHIVITSISAPTEAVRQFARLCDFRLTVVGDEKSPQDWHCENVNFIPLAQQHNLGFALPSRLPNNHYCRKMIGYLQAIRQEATVIIDTDDDNIPKPGWQFPAFEGGYEAVAGNQGFVNVYRLFTEQHIWPRGLPLDLIRAAAKWTAPLTHGHCRVGVWQGLADGEPDVDAIYRLTCDAPCYFNDREPVVLGKGTISPFNSQNTAIRKSLFPLLYLPTTVSFRFTDILRGLVAQPIMWAHGYQLGFTRATVIQKRNPHDYLQDFTSEIPMYRYGTEIVDIVTDAITAGVTIEHNLLQAYDALAQRGVVKQDELYALEAWLQDLAT